MYLLLQQGVTRLDILNFISHGISKLAPGGDAVTGKRQSMTRTYLPRAFRAGARMITDCRVDALTSERPYRRQLSHDAALAIIHDGRGTTYDPSLADAFLRLAESFDTQRACEPAGAEVWGFRFREARAV